MNFLARVIIGGIITFTTIVILENSKRKFEEEAKKHKDTSKKDKSKKNVADDNSIANTYDKYLFDFENYSPAGSKRKITRAAKEIMAQYKTRKIGRTGDRDGRLGNYNGKYTKLYLLTKSKDLNLIKDLEAAYIDKFQADIANKNPGILGANETVDGWYYLYIAVK